MRANYNSIDIIKFVMSLMVVVIHCFIIDDIINVTNVIVGNAVNTLIHQAVPFFFVTSAFLLFTKLKIACMDGVDRYSCVRKKLTNYLKHILRMYIVWFLIFCVFGIAKNDSADVAVFLVGRVFEFVCWGGGNHLWYLWALLLVLPVVAIAVLKLDCFSKPNRTLLLIAAGIVAMFFFRFYSHYGSVSNPSWWQKPLVWGWQGHIFNVFGVCDAIMYLSVGVFFALTSIWEIWKNWILLCIGTFCILLSYFDNGAPSLVKIPVIFAIMTFVLRWKLQGNVVVYKFLRSMSTFIYLVHPICIDLSRSLTDSPFIKTGCSLLFCVIIGYVFVIISRRFKFFNYLV